jgi:DNA-binding MarR family transcriptional regulator
MSAAKKHSTKIALGALHNELGFHLAQASIITSNAFNQFVGEPLQLRKVEYSLLMLLQANHALSPKQLAKSLALTAPNLTMLLDRLQERDWIVRERNPNDGRSQHVRLTAAGEALMREASSASKGMAAQWQKNLTSAENAMLIELLSKVYQD